MAFGDQKGTLTGNAGSITNPFSATGSVVVAVGDLIFALITERGANTTTACADNLGNTYTAQNAGTLATNAAGRAFYSRVTVAGTLTSVNFTTTASSDDVAAMAAVFEGNFTSPPIDANPANVTTAGSPFSCPASGTLAQASELVVSWMACANGKTDILATSPSTLSLNTASGTGANTIGGAIARRVVSATTTITPQFTAVSGASSGGNVQGTASFKQGPQNWQVTAAFAGVGALSSTLALGARVSASFGGAGSLTLDSRRLYIGLNRIRRSGWPAIGEFAVGQYSRIFPPARTNHQVSATFVGAGGFSGNVFVVKNISASFGGAGGLAATLNLAETVSATFGGVGSLTANIIRTTAHQVAATFVGTGNLTATLNLGIAVSASFAGAGSLSGAPFVIKNLSATFNGTGSLGVSLNLGMGVSAAFGGVGSLTGNITTQKNLAAAFAGAGGLGVSLNLGMQISATFGGVGLLNSEVFIPGVSTAWQVEAAFNGTGQLVATLNMRIGVLGALAGAGSLTASLSQGMRVSASLAGVGSLAVPSLLQNMAVLSTFAGAGTLVADLSKFKQISATFAGAGGLVSTLNLGMQVFANFAGVGFLTANVTNQPPTVQQLVSANFAGVGGLTASLRQGMAVTASFSGVGLLTGQLRLNMRISAAFAGVGAMAADVQLPVRQQVAALFAGSGSLSADIIIIPTIFSTELPAGYESQVGVWHAKSGSSGRTGKRYRIYKAH